MFAPFRYDTNVYAGIGEIIILTGSEQTADLNIRADFFARAGVDGNRYKKITKLVQS